MSLSTEMIRSAIGGTRISADARADAKRVVEIACLAVAADGNLAAEELHVIRVLCKEMKVDVGTVDEVLALGDREDRLTRLREVAAAIESPEAKKLAYKMTVLTSLSDLAAQDEEFEFDLDVQEALGIDTDTAEALANEVNEVLMPPEE